MSKLSVVCFDLGSTLLYFDGVMSELVPEANRRLCDALITMGYRVDPEYFIATFQDGLQEYFRQRDIDHVETTVEAMLCRILAGMGHPRLPLFHLKAALHEMYKVTQAHWQLEEDTLPVLSELKQRGYRLGLISNASNADDVYTQLDKYNLAPYFDQILISAAVGYRKPHPYIFHLALEFFGLPPERAVMVGDLPTADISGARNVGMASVWITRRVRDPKNAPAIQADAVIETLQELPPALEHFK
jgi:putative hydrolase of the HAD superfamily